MTKTKSFYDLSKNERTLLVDQIYNDIVRELQSSDFVISRNYMLDNDTYVRKAAYTVMGKIYKDHLPLRGSLLNFLSQALEHPHEHMRQTAINAAGEIGKIDFDIVQPFFDKGLFDAHHAPRNAVIGSIKKMSEVNPIPVLEWAKKYLKHPEKEVRREICHGIELRGRKYPEDILPLLQTLEWDKTKRVSNTLVHVIGQIAYKKGCLPKVIAHLNNWENQALVQLAIAEILNVHIRYQNFAHLTHAEALVYIKAHYVGSPMYEISD